MLNRTVRALTVSQPYAALIASGEKWIENRRWPTTYRGPLAIHAGKGTQYLSPAELRRHTTGAFVAVCQLAACLNIDFLRRMRQDVVIAVCGRTPAEILAHEHAEGPYLWVLQDVRAVDPPIEYVGQRGLWHAVLPADLFAPQPAVR